jgi:hypothetical protein
LFRPATLVQQRVEAAQGFQHDDDVVLGLVTAAYYSVAAAASGRMTYMSTALAAGGVDTVGFHELHGHRIGDIPAE